MTILKSSDNDSTLKETQKLLSEWPRVAHEYQTTLRKRLPSPKFCN